LDRRRREGGNDIGIRIIWFFLIQRFTELDRHTSSIVYTYRISYIVGRLGVWIDSRIYLERRIETEYIRRCVIRNTISVVDRVGFLDESFIFRLWIVSPAS
jgi:hypothetical protein